MSNEAFIVSAVRTPMGSFGGTLAGVPATKLGARAIAGAVEKAGVEPGRVEEVYMGNVVAANLGQAPARQASKLAGLADDVTCTTVNKVCASGLKAVAIAAQSVWLGDSEVVVAGGMESMSNIPYYIPKARFGYGYGHGELVDGLARDGLQDAYDGTAMGVCGDRTAERYGITREQQDVFAARSYRLSSAAWENGRFAEEVVAVETPGKRGGNEQVSRDEEFSKVNFDKIPLLKPAFGSNGTVTAANASTINDGAAALVLVSAGQLKQSGLRPLARIVAFADAEQEPQWFTTTPVLATEKVLRKAGLKMGDIDLFEVNEAFAVVALTYMQLLDIPEGKVNIHGGAVALGHPLGASGARILTTLVHALRVVKGRYGLAAICNGGGGATAMVIENMSDR